MGQAEGWLGWSAYPFPWRACVQGAHAGPHFCSPHLKVAAGVLVFLCLVVHNLPQLPMHAIIFVVVQLLSCVQLFVTP